MLVCWVVLDLSPAFFLQRMLDNVARVVREEMERIGGQEVLFPAIIPREIFEDSGRYADYGDGIFRLTDRKGAEHLLGPTHEELFTLLVKGELSSYRDFPVTLFQIQTKYRDEARPRAGLLRLRLGRNPPGGFFQRDRLAHAALHPSAMSSMHAEPAPPCSSPR